MRVDVVPLQTIGGSGNVETVNGMDACIPVCDSVTDPDYAEAVLRSGGSPIHSLRMKKMVAPVEDRFAYVIEDEAMRYRPGNAFEHTINVAVNDLILSRTGPVSTQA